MIIAIYYISIVDELIGAKIRSNEMKLGFIGLGSLGTAIAQRLIEQGENIVVWNRTKSKIENIKAEVAVSPAEVVKQCSVIILNLFDSDAVHDVMVAENGLLSVDGSNNVIIDTTTNNFNAVLTFSEMFENNNFKYLEAPVIGSVVPALNGQLTSVIGGEKSEFEKVKYIIEKYSSNIFHYSDIGKASKIKIINNLILGSFMSTLAESISIAEKSGIDKKQFIDIISVGAGNSGVLNAKKKKLLEEDFSNHFSSECIHKDLKYLQELTNDLNCPSFIGSVVKNIYAMTFSKNIENQDFSGVYNLFKGE